MRGGKERKKEGKQSRWSGGWVDHTLPSVLSNFLRSQDSTLLAGLPSHIRQKVCKIAQLLGTIFSLPVSALQGECRTVSGFGCWVSRRLLLHSGSTLGA
jgi:hypothetical protein